MIKIFKYLFAINELLQFKHLNKTQANNDDLVTVSCQPTSQVIRTKGRVQYQGG
jgi:hypothetical protein